MNLDKGMSIGILGCGPSGLAALHGAFMALGANVASAHYSFYSKMRKSEIYGAQYLHQALPGVDCGEPSTLAVQFYGDAEGYRTKVYGADYQGTVSPQDFRDDHRAWDLRRAYANLWDWYTPEAYGVDMEFNRVDFMDDYEVLIANHDIVFSTIPRKVLCINPEHEFKSQMVYAIGDAPARGIKCPVTCEVDTLVYNGSPDYGWYRKSNIFGHTTAEWPASADRPKPPISNLALVEKPLSTNCDCWPALKFVGRYGAWRKGVLVHQVYNEAYGIADEFLRKGTQNALF